MSQVSFSDSQVQTIWKQVCAHLQVSLSPAVFNTWIVSSPITSIEPQDSGSLLATITSPTTFHATNLKKNLDEKIKKALLDVVKHRCDTNYLVGEIITTSKLTNKTSHIATNKHLDDKVSADITASKHLDDKNADITANKHLNNKSADITASKHSTHNNSANLENDGFAISKHDGSKNQKLEESGANFDLYNNFKNTGAIHNQKQFSSFSNNFGKIKNPSQKNKSSMQNQSPRVEDLFSEATMSSVLADRIDIIARRIGLRTDYTFDNFAVSTSNEMAHAAATAVTKRPGVAYNPLFLYGGVGVGKTHLMHAIGNFFLKNEGVKNIIYCSGEEFTNELVASIQTKKTRNFKQKYRDAEMLLIDDIQFIAGKNAVQEEFFHTFNALTKHNKQIILTSDRPPQEIALLEDRLRSRFQAGLMIDIGQPSFELRVAIVLVKAKNHNLNLDIEMAKNIASAVDSARKIEGLITTIRSEVELKEKKVDDSLIQEVLKSEIAFKKQPILMKPSDVIKIIASHFQLKQSDLRGQRRQKNVVHARHIAMFVLKEDADLPLVEVGRWFSGRDHTTILHAVNKIKTRLKENPQLQRDVASIRTILSK